jgi:hypothetical protein
MEINSKVFSKDIDYYLNSINKLIYTSIEAEYLEKIYNVSLEFIINCLNAVKASILLFDQQGIMKFVA